MSDDADSQIIFTVRLNEEDWEVSRRSWRCPSLAIPSATIKDVFVTGNRVDKADYEVVEGPKAIRWIAGPPPKQVTAEIRLGEQLSTQSETGRWKKLAIVLPVAGMIAVALIGAFAPHLFSSDVAGAADTLTAQLNEVDVKPNALTFRIAVEPLDMAHYIKKSDVDKYQFVVGIRADSETAHLQGQYEHAYQYPFDNTPTQAPKLDEPLLAVAATDCVDFVLFRISDAGLVRIPFKTPFVPANYGSDLKILNTRVFGNKCP